MSLVIFNNDFTFQRVKTTQNSNKETITRELAKQGSLFNKIDSSCFTSSKQLPYKFSYQFTDDENVSSTLMISDWEIGQLYWNFRKKA